MPSQKPICLLHAGFLPGLLFDLKTEAIWVFETPIDSHWTTIPEHKIIHSYACENLKSNKMMSCIYFMKSQWKEKLHYKLQVLTETLDTDIIILLIICIVGLGECVAVSGNFLNHCLTRWRTRKENVFVMKTFYFTLSAVSLLDEYLTSRIFTPPRCYNMWRGVP
jgi:hypothetical protein